MFEICRIKTKKQKKKKKHKQLKRSIGFTVNVVFFARS